MLQYSVFVFIKCNMETVLLIHITNEELQQNFSRGKPISTDGVAQEEKQVCSITVSALRATSSCQLSVTMTKH